MDKRLLLACVSCSMIAAAGCAGDLPSASQPDPWKSYQGSSSYAAPSYVGSPAPRVAAPPPKPAIVTKWNANSDDVPEMFACLGKDVCGTIEERARLRAAEAFGCPVSTIETKARPTKGLAVHPSAMVFTAKGTVQLHLSPARPGDAFYVSGCGQRALLACVWGNRSVRTADITYENVEDRVCLWADWVDPE